MKDGGKPRRAGARRRRAGASVAGALVLAAALALAACDRGAPEQAASEDPGAEAEPAAESARESGASAEPEGGAEGAADGSEKARLFPRERDRLGVSIGADDAPVVVREFADYQCPACAHFSQAAKRLREELVAAGTVRYVFFDLPLPSIHRHAVAAAQAARCAGRQDAYWPMHDRLFERQEEWSAASDPLPRFRAYGEALGLDAEALARCVESGATREAVEESHAFASRVGVRATPTVLVGDRVSEEFTFRGSRSYEEVRALVERAARRAEGTTSTAGEEEEAS